MRVYRVDIPTGRSRQLTLRGRSLPSAKRSSECMPAVSIRSIPRFAPTKLRTRGSLYLPCSEWIWQAR